MPDTSDVTFVRLSAVDPAALVALMNDPRVRRHMPLARGAFGEAECARFVVAKERLWATHGYGPWAFVVDGVVAGWGGLQPEGDDVDLGIVLHPSHWGAGRAILARLLRDAFEGLGAPSVVILLPPSRVRTSGVRRAGFVPDGELTVGGERFVRFRCWAPSRDRGPAE
jgi:RimJ/RimL family protein N-acetyltransferase